MPSGWHCYRQRSRGRGVTPPSEVPQSRLAEAGWPLLPLHGKVPDCRPRASRRDHPMPRQWPAGGSDGRTANVGARVPESLIVVDIDPRAGGWGSLACLEAEHGPLPATLTVRTGGADRGEHRYFVRPPGPLAMAKLGPGVDLRLPGKHYTVLPPSIHPETRRAYEWADVTVVPVFLPGWLTTLLRPSSRPSPPSRPVLRCEAVRPGDHLAASATWHEILEPHGWSFAGSRGEVGYWRRPGKAGGTISATTNLDFSRD